LKFANIHESNNEKKKKEAEGKITAVKNELKQLEEKSLLTKTYIELWNNEISEKQKEMNGIDIEIVKEFISKILQKHHLVNVQSNFSALETIPSADSEGMEKPVVIVGSAVTIQFNSLTEYPLYYLIRELAASKMFFLDLESFSIKKVKNLDKNVINNLVKGTLDYVLEIELKLHLYNAVKTKK
jgi:hypothetical protein